MCATQSQPLDRQFTCMIAALNEAEGRGASAPIESLVVAALIRLLLILARLAQDWQAGRPSRELSPASRYRPATPRPGDIPLRIRRRARTSPLHPHTPRASTRRAPAPSFRAAHAPSLPHARPMPACRARRPHLQVRPPLAAWRATRPPDSSKRPHGQVPTCALNVAILQYYEESRGSRHIGRRARTGSSSDQSPASTSCPFGNGARGSSPSERTTRSSR